MGAPGVVVSHSSMQVAGYPPAAGYPPGAAYPSAPGYPSGAHEAMFAGQTHDKVPLVV